LGSGREGIFSERAIYPVKIFSKPIYQQNKMFVFEGFIIGLLGSLHCLGMCGPLVLALPLSHTSNIQRLTGGLLYNIGRAITYGVLGIIFGVIGKGLQLTGFQRWVSIGFGIILILTAIIPGLINLNPLISRITTKFTSSLKNKMGVLLRQQRVYPLFVFGLLNGLLPCGLVYAAIMGAIVTGSLVESSLYMFFFGLGTLPLMFLLIYFANLLKNKYLSQIRKIIPLLIIILGILFILRGLNLGIKYISPKLDGNKHGMEQKCCH
jgi:sulfite exporter TauE/SafE